MAARRAPRTATVEAPAHREEPTPRLFTVDEYYKMAEAGILRPDERVELIDGRIVEMPPIGPEHADSVDTVVEIFGDRLRPRVRIRVQSPLQIGILQLPEPDVSLIKTPAERGSSYRKTHPRLDDILLVVEVADTTLQHDLGEKARMYARAGVPELWVIDVPHDRLVVHREPAPDGYASIVTVNRGETLSALAFPDVTFTADEILG
jgi:Uma2 family endonuclease